MKIKDKVFCIGFNKTGTTSLARLFQEWNVKSGSQSRGELLLKAYEGRDFKSIVRFCRSATFFQDVPFSLPYTFVSLDQAYPRAKFILTVRSSTDEWYQSLLRFHALILNVNPQKISAEHLKRSKYVYPGWMWDAQRVIYGVDESAPYDEHRLKQTYELHNAMVQDYFRTKGNLLVVNLKDTSAFPRFCEFLGVESSRQDFPWENKSS